MSEFLKQRKNKIFILIEKSKFSFFFFTLSPLLIEQSCVDSTSMILSNEKRLSGT